MSDVVLEIKIKAGEAGLFHAICPQLCMLVSGESVQEVLDAVPVVYRAILDAQEQTPTQSGTPDENISASEQGVTRIGRKE